MLGSFRSFFQSRVGVIVTLGFLALIAIAFASADVTGNMFGGVAGSDRIATVGKGRVDTAELKTALNNAFEQQREKNPTLTMQQFLATGAMDELVNELIAREALMQFGEKHGFAVSDRLVDSELIKIPAFLGPDGKFSETTYRQLLATRNLTDAQVRDDFNKQLMSRQLLLPATYGAVMPMTAVTQYVSILKERRIGSVAVIPSLAFAPQTGPDDATLTAFYNKNKARYTQPERRTVRYAVFDAASLKNVPAPTEAEIAKRYKDNSAVYAPSETRTLTQVILPTEAAAKALAAEVVAGKSLEAAATAKGLAPTKLDRMAKGSFAGQTSQAIADAVFAAAQGQLAAPGKSALGWHLVRVDAIERNPGKTLDQARGEITEQLAVEKRRAALSDVAARIEQEFEDGGSLADAAKELGLEIATTAPLTASGEVFGKPGEMAPEAVAPVVQAAFSMEREGEPQLAEVQAGGKIAMFEVGQITAAAPAPLAEIKDYVANDWKLEQGSIKASQASEKVLAQLAKGVPLETALASVGVKLPAPSPVDMTREQLLSVKDRAPPPSLALLFSMAKGSNKRLEAPGKAGWFIVSVKDIIPGKIAADDPMLASAVRDLGGITGQEYAQQMRAAIRAEIGSEKNEGAIKAVRTDLLGSGQ
jgi:peptidyl-prolyl cis-trans isomerase D